MIESDTNNFLDSLVFDAKGLIPAIVQDVETKQVLMLAWMNRDAVEHTINEGRTVFWSRSRKELWRKGDTSGNIQSLVSIAPDCDADTLLVTVHQHGAACHTGTSTCFTGRALPSLTDSAGEHLP